MPYGTAAPLSLSPLWKTHFSSSGSKPQWEKLYIASLRHSWYFSCAAISSIQASVLVISRWVMFRSVFRAMWTVDLTSALLILPLFGNAVSELVHRGAAFGNVFIQICHSHTGTEKKSEPPIWIIDCASTVHVWVSDSCTRVRAMRI